MAKLRNDEWPLTLVKDSFPSVNGPYHTRAEGSLIDRAMRGPAISRPLSSLFRFSAKTFPPKGSAAHGPGPHAHGERWAIMVVPFGGGIRFPSAVGLRSHSLITSAIRGKGGDSDAKHQKSDSHGSGYRVGALALVRA